jgi:lipoprotein signal peptidase
MKNVYLALAFLGLILPYSQFVPFIIDNGLNFSMIVTEITGYRLSTFAWLDVVVTALAIITLILDEKKLKNWWIPALATLIIGPSCGLPLYLYMRD